MLSWPIVNVEECAYWAERADMEARLAALGYDAKAFIALSIDAHPGLTLAALHQQRVRQKLRLALASRGVMLTPPPLGRLIEMLERHQPLALAPMRQTPQP